MTEENLSAIVNLLLKDVEKKLEHFNVSLEISDSAKLLIKDGTDIEYGARPLKRVIQKEIEDPVANLILEDGLEGKSVLQINTDDKNKLTFTAK